MTTPQRAFPGCLFAALVAVVSCLPGARAPEVTPTRTLQIGGEPPAKADPKAFAVVFASPRGTQVEASEVTLVFNRSMHPFEIAGQESAPPASIVARGGDRPPPGSWRWMGTSALVFAPDPALAAATEYVVTVPAGTKAMSGETLAAPFTFSFSTPAPHLVRSDPSDGADHLGPDATFSLGFNQRVDPAEVERAATLKVGDGKDERKIAVRASRPKPDDQKLVKLAPASPLPLASHVRLELADSLHGLEGPLPAGRTERVDAHTYGPLTATVRCYGRQTGHCSPWESFSLELSNGARFDAVKAHVRVDPPVPVHWMRDLAGDSQDSSYSIPARTSPGATYRVTVSAGLRDEYGQTLAHDTTSTLVVDDLDPNVVVGVNGSVAEAAPGRPRVVPVASVNVDHYVLATGAVDEPTLARLLDESAHEAGPKALEAVQKTPGIKVETVTSAAPRNARYVKNVPLDGLLAGKAGRGAAVVATQWGTSFVGVTDLGITGKMSRFGSVVWVTRLSDGKPVAGVTVSVFDEHGTVFEARTDGDGLVAIPADAYAPANADGTIDQSRILVARQGDDWTWRRMTDVASWGGGGVWVDVSGGLAPMGMLFTDRGVYRPGETMKVPGMFRSIDVTGMHAIAGDEVRVDTQDATGEVVFSTRVPLDKFGAFATEVPLPKTAHLGDSRVVAAIHGRARNAEAVEVFRLAAYKASEFKLEAFADAKTYVRGDDA
ncbi:MAG TPA: Ig-like domain-containing protein, partial [Polyangiaceae bacterium]|nr:Ig-like domain-containing protein [Polyangiaceae bacterium]